MYKIYPLLQETSSSNRGPPNVIHGDCRISYLLYRLRQDLHLYFTHFPRIPSYPVRAFMSFAALHC